MLLEKPSDFKRFTQVAIYTIGQRGLSIFGYCAAPELRHDQLTHGWQMSPEEKYILLMEAAYTATDKETYYKLMKKADQVLKDIQVIVDSIDAEAA